MRIIHIPKTSKQTEMLWSQSSSDQESHQHTVRWGGFVSQDPSVLAFLPKPARRFTLACDIHILVIHKHTAPSTSVTWVAHWWEENMLQMYWNWQTFKQRRLWASPDISLWQWCLFEFQFLVGRLMVELPFKIKNKHSTSKPISNSNISDVF